MGAGVISTKRLAYSQWMQFIEAQPRNIADPALRELIGFALFRPISGRIDSFLERVDYAQTRIYLAVEDGSIHGQMTVTRPASEGGSAREGTIKSIGVLQDRQGQGTGRFLVSGYCELFPEMALLAETDDSSVGFYHCLGFRIRSLGEKHPGTIRYNCVFDPEDVAPLSCRDAVTRFQAAGIRCWVAGRSADASFSRGP